MSVQCVHPAQLAGSLLFPSHLLQVSLGNLATLDAALAAAGLALIATLVHHKVRHFSERAGRERMCMFVNVLLSIGRDQGSQA